MLRPTLTGLVLVCILAALPAPSPAGAADLHVPGDFPTIPEAITAAEDGDVIIVAPGVYTGTVNPFGKAITIRSTDPDDPQVVRQTVLDGAGERTVAFFSGEGLDTVLEGFTITGGHDEQGGGIGIYVSDPIVRKSIVRGNSATQGGGAYVYASSPWFDEVSFIDNSALDGGGLYAYAATYARFDGCKFVRNVATSDGGAIATNFSSLRFDGCLIADNRAGDGGGAYDSYETAALFVSSLIRDNTAAFGGALSVVDKGPELLNSTVVRNTATDTDGGAIYGIMSQPLVRNSIVRDNLPNEFGGFGNNPTAEYSNVTGGLSGPGNIDADPLFRDPARNDFRLTPPSPSRDSGFDGWVPSYGLRDLGEQPRILGPRVDMGAYETRGRKPKPPVDPGSLVVATRDEGAIAFGLESPLLAFDAASGEWQTLVRNLPAYAIAADPDCECFWLHSGENGLLGRVPWDTLELEEIGVLKYEGSAAFALSGMAARDGVLYATAWVLGQPDRLYTIDPVTANLTLVAELPEEYDLWDLHYDAASDRMLILSSPEVVPPGPVGIYEIDLGTFELTEVQRWFNDDPFSELNWLQGLATGDGLNYIFRSPYNKIEIFDEATLELLETVSVPDEVDRPGAGWLWGGLTWMP
jgi:predicted outer membrane repeat protein